MTINNAKNRIVSKMFSCSANSQLFIDTWTASDEAELSFIICTTEESSENFQNIQTNTSLKQ